MAKTFDIVGYTYRAANYCPDCIIDNLRTRADFMDVWPPGFNAEEWLNRCARVLGIDREDERTFDSDHFPKVLFRDQASDIDAGGGGERCERCHVKLADLEIP